MRSYESVKGLSLAPLAACLLVKLILICYIYCSYSTIILSPKNGGLEKERANLLLHPNRLLRIPDATLACRRW
jgi:hypothetical protein